MDWCSLANFFILGKHVNELQLSRTTGAKMMSQVFLKEMKWINTKVSESYVSLKQVL